MTCLRVTLLLLLATTSLMATVSADELTRQELQFFESKIRPVLIQECYRCHSNQSGNVRGGLRLDTRELTHIGGSSGPAIVPGNLPESLLLNAIEHVDFEMPPNKKLPEDVIADFRTWIEMGAPDPRATKLDAIKSTISEADIAEARESFWSYQSPVRVSAPQVKDAAWPRSEIDRFVLAKLEEAGLSPAEDALPHQVLRRLCYDLVGLPPTPEQLETFQRMWAKDAERAVAFVVDRLLESERFGERWGRHWLDVARYAESTGREVNMTYPHAWRYRDYVIDAFNADKPFDEFVQEQIAGDLLPVETDAEWAEHLVATTFLAVGPKNLNEQNRAQFQADLVDEQIDATTRVFLGLSVACARCHDHKFDAVPQTDYYALAGIFGSATTYFGNPPSEYGSFAPLQVRRQSSLILLPIDDPNPYDPSYTAAEMEQLRDEMDELLEQVNQSRRELLTALTGRTDNNPNSQRERILAANRLATLSDKLAVVDGQGKPRSYCMGVQDRLPARDARLLVRGEIDQAAQTVPRGFPQVLSDEPLRLSDSTRSGRLELARFIGSDANPLTARVMVNRVWQHLLGQGLVTSTDNFGVTGAAPSHPELLDYLAVGFVESGWSVKSVIRAIATSRVYRISSEFNPAYHTVDPDNALLWRATPRRVDAEALRDAMLSISGELDFERPHGSEVAKAGYTRVREGILGDPREILQQTVTASLQSMRETFRDRLRNRRGPFGRGRDQKPSAEESRQSLVAAAMREATHQLDMEQATFRSVYLPVVRDAVPRGLDVFDFADANSIVGTREVSNSPDQALYMLNNNFVLARSDAFATRVARGRSAGREPIDRAFELAFGRLPTQEEHALASKFLERDGGNLSQFCQSLFASAEFRLID